MGTCCFTPKKTHFLWWYWLALASIIGIPMLLAALYVKRHKARGDDPELVAHAGAKMFWTLSALFVFGLSTVVLFSDALFRVGDFPDPHVAAKLSMTLHVLILDFFVCFIMTSFAVKPRSQAPVLGMIICLFGWCIIEQFAFMVNPLDLFAVLGDGSLDEWFMAVSMLTFVACLPGAWGWRHFIYESTTKTARRALGLIVLSSILFYGAARYGNLAHLYLYDLARGRIPSVQEIDDHSMK